MHSRFHALVISPVKTVRVCECVRACVCVCVCVCVYLSSAVTIRLLKNVIEVDENDFCFK